jgi:hypothetical protein
MLCIFWLMAYYALLSLGKALGDKGVLHPIPAVWLPNVIVASIGLHFFRQALRESPLHLPKFFGNAAGSAERMAQMIRLRVRS